MFYYSEPERSMMILRTKVVVERVGLSRSHLWRLERDGQFPRKIRLGPNSVGYVESEIDEWIAARIAERDDQDSNNRG